MSETVTVTLTEFLLARIAEREADAWEVHKRDCASVGVVSEHTAERDVPLDEWEWCTDECPEGCEADHQGEE